MPRAVRRLAGRNVFEGNAIPLASTVGALQRVAAFKVWTERLGAVCAQQASVEFTAGLKSRVEVNAVLTGDLNVFINALIK